MEPSEQFQRTWVKRQGNWWSEKELRSYKLQYCWNRLGYWESWEDLQSLKSQVSLPVTAKVKNLNNNNNNNNNKVTMGNICQLKLNSWFIWTDWEKKLILKRSRKWTRNKSETCLKLCTQLSLTQSEIWDRLFDSNLLLQVSFFLFFFLFFFFFCFVIQ